MKWLLVFVLFPSSVLGSEQCVTQLGGKCRAVCGPDEKSEQGAFIDCAEKEKCCVPASAREAPVASSAVVLIDQMAFSPGVMTVKVGTEVVWKNNDSSVHVVKADDGSFSSPPLELGSVFKRTFTKPGTYSYACEMHPFMSGKIVVQ